MKNQQYDYDVLYIGSGHGTFDGAIPLAAKGFKVGIVEYDLVGGTCPNRGCNAKITLDAPVALQRQFENLNGVIEGEAKINWSANLAHKQEVIGKLPDMIAGLAKSVHIDILSGHGVLDDPHTVLVDGTPKTAEKIVIATGLRPHRLDISGSELAHDSSDFMNLSAMPKRLTVIGSGYIAMEFATMANAAGSEVTVITHGNHALRKFNQDFVEKIIDDLQKRGVKFVRNTEVTSFEKTGTALTVNAEDNFQLETDWILDATGRIPNVEKIGLDKLGVEYNKNGVVVNDHLQTNVPNIYASGDVIDKIQPKLTPTAVFESTYLMHQFASDSSSAIDYPAIPSVVFTSPRIAQVGVTPEEAKKNPDKYTIETHHTPDDWYRQVDKEQLGDNALIFDKEHHLVGASEFSDKADDAINTLLPAIEFKLGPEQLGRLIYLFPSISSSAAGQL
ncbi:Glutathione reductase [Oenococcus oeni]|uniref:Glutathione reductase n=2 Tax=Oenococcus oeni TaxID=1247 RepID=A0AAQ2UT95_OENOE|nr:NAD(P)/FAD-dependent oxidoreductase [Oenococcus oeni]VDB98425.1 Glutathione reductase [Oenococcus oeni]